MESSLVSLGKQIHSIRKKKKIQLEYASKSLKIPVKFLEQIEEGDLIDSISNSTTILFIKAYLDFLGSDSKELILQYKECFSVIKRNRTLDECAVKLDCRPRTIDLKVSIIVSSLLLLLSSYYFFAKRDVDLNLLNKEVKLLLSTY